MAQVLPSTFKLTGKTVVVTGANRGIGLEFAKQLLDKGNTVVASVRDPEGATELQSLKPPTPASLVSLPIDTGDHESIKSWAKKVAEVTPKVDVVINNAGILRSGNMETTTPEDMLDSFRVNAMGPFLIVQALLNQSLLPSGSLVVNITSLVASITENGSGSNYAYRMSKIAANMATKNMSIELAPKGITSTILHPGYVRTGMTKGNGLIDVDESVAGMLGVLESGVPLNGEWYHTSGRHLPW